MALNKILLSDGVTELANVKSVVFHEAVNADEDLRPGCVGSASIEVDVFNSQANAVAAGDVVYCYQIDKNDVETLLGQFVCEPKIDTKNSYSFTAYDNAQKLNADFSQWLMGNQAAFPMTVYQLVSHACAVAGVTLGSSSWGLSTQSVGAFYADGITCRDILSYAAEIGCCFVRCHTDGSIYFDWYSANAKTIGPTIGTNRYAYKQDGLTYANYTTTALARVAVHPSGEDDVAYIYPTGVTSGNTMHIKNNLLLTGADASFYEAVAQQVYTVMSALGTYRPMTANLFAKENPFRAGDIVSVTDSQGVTFNSVVMDMSVSPSGAMLTSTGREVYGEYALETAKQLVQLAADIVRINKLKVDWADIGTAIVDTLQANGINADWINAGALTITDGNGNIIFKADATNKTVQIANWSATDDFLTSVDENNKSLQLGSGKIIFNEQIGFESYDTIVQSVPTKGIDIQLIDTQSQTYGGIYRISYKQSGTEHSLYRIMLSSNLSEPWHNFTGRIITNSDIAATSASFFIPLPIDSGGTGVASLDALLTLLMGNVRFETFRLDSGLSKTFTFTGVARGIFFIMSSVAAGREIAMYGVLANGNTGVTRVTNASGLTFTTATNSLTINNNAGAYVYIAHMKYIV